MFAGVRELASLSSPWFFKAVPVANASDYEDSWLTAFDPDGLGGPSGLRTAEKRHPKYVCEFGCCSWSGPVWPFETAKAITGVINVLNHYPTVTTLDGDKFYTLLSQYAASHTPLWAIASSTRTGIHNLSNSSLNVFAINGTGINNFWIAETGCGDKEMTTKQYSGPIWTDSGTQGYRYNHATFMDLVLSGVVGLQPSSSGLLTINPLVSSSTLPWWTADGVRMRNKIISVRFDVDGLKYNRDVGLVVFVDGVITNSSKTLRKLTVQLV